MTPSENYNDNNSPNRVRPNQNINISSNVDLNVPMDLSGDETNFTSMLAESDSEASESSYTSSNNSDTEKKLLTVSPKQLTPSKQQAQ